jgi:rubrerythrin
LKGSKTEKNLLASFAGESQARNRYTFFASIAKKEGYEQISSIFKEGVIGSTFENLKAGAEGERLEWGTIYPNFADVAEEEGLEDVAHTFRMVAEVERSHERRYLKLLVNIQQGKVFKKDTSIKWKCRNCGYVYENNEAPKKCPVCEHTQSYFEVWCENY